ncbi:caspase domain-containing protein [Mycena epipterygia]|nr:caspase domain-containing protein [Mycena epipterygia]
MSTATSTFRSTFALIIGINEYAAPEIPSLAGCTYDAKRFKNFLTADCGVPDAQIQFLTNKQATRQHIIDTFQTHFINNKEIPDIGALMIFFFAGHGGSYQNPESDEKIETICPYDERTWNGDQEVYGIPDYVLGWLLEDLSQKKGSNITVISDSCHSGGLSRNADGGTIRRLTSTAPVPLKIDIDLWKNIMRTEPISKWRSSSSPYTLLAACQAEEVACEALLPHPTDAKPDATQVMGRFTTALLDALRRALKNLSNTTYSDLLKSFDRSLLPSQHPHCGHMNQDRLVFTNTKPSPSWGLVQNPADPNTFLVDIGSTWGITHDTEFSLISQGGEVVGALMVKDSKPDKSILAFKGETSFPLDGHRVRVKTWKNPSVILNVFADKDFPSHTLEVKGIDNPCKFMVTEKAKANIVLQACGDNHKTIMIEWQTGTITQYAKQNSFILRDTRYLPTILDGISHFNYTLNHNGSNKNYDINVQLKLYELDGEFGHREPKLPVDDIVKNGVARLTAEKGKKYGFEMCNDSPYNLFPYLFYFNPQTYEIDALYLPTGGDSKPSLSSKKKIQLGVGNTPAFEFDADPSSMLGFLKMFVFARYHPLDWIVQGLILEESQTQDTGRKFRTEKQEIPPDLGKAIQVTVVVTE